MIEFFLATDLFLMRLYASSSVSTANTPSGVNSYPADSTSSFKKSICELRNSTSPPILAIANGIDLAAPPNPPATTLVPPVNGTPGAVNRIPASAPIPIISAPIRAMSGSIIPAMDLNNSSMTALGCSAMATNVPNHSPYFSCCSALVFAKAFDSLLSPYLSMSASYCALAWKKAFTDSSDGAAIINLISSYCSVFAYPLANARIISSTMSPPGIPLFKISPAIPPIKLGSSSKYFTGTRNGMVPIITVSKRVFALPFSGDAKPPSGAA